MAGCNINFATEPRKACQATDSQSVKTTEAGGVSGYDAPSANVPFASVVAARVARSF